MHRSAEPLLGMYLAERGIYAASMHAGRTAEKTRARSNMGGLKRPESRAPDANQTPRLLGPRRGQNGSRLRGWTGGTPALLMEVFKPQA